LTPTKPVTSVRSRAVTQLTGWFEAVGVPVAPGEGEVDLVVTDSKGVAVPLVLEEGPRKAPSGALGVSLASIWSRDIPEALEAFQEAARALGYGSVQPLPNRGGAEEAPDELDFWLRHREVRRSPNPSEEVFRQYDVIIKQRSHMFFNSNSFLLDRIGWTVDDVQQHVMMFVVAFNGLFRICKAGVTARDNQRMLHEFIKQRLVELRNRISKQSDLYGYNPAPPEEILEINAAVTYEALPDVDESPLLDLEDIEKNSERRKGAKTILKTSLRTMPIEIARQKLLDLATSPNMPEVVQLEATRQLNLLPKKRRRHQATT
jgi:hypothetical protein